MLRSLSTLVALVVMPVLVLAACRPVAAPVHHSGGQPAETPSASGQAGAPPVRAKRQSPQATGVVPAGQEAACPEEAQPAAPERDASPSADLAGAVELHDQGRVEEALDAGLALLGAVTALQLDSAELRLLLGEWAIEAGNGVLAEEQLQAALAVLSREDGLDERVGSRLRAAQALAYGSDSVALAEARALFDEGAWADADQQLKHLFATATDEEVLRQGESLRETIYLESVARVEAALARVDALLAQDWQIEKSAGDEGGEEGEDDEGPVAPDVEVQRLLAGIESLPLDTWVPAEVTRRRTFLATRVASSSLEAQAVLEREWEATLDEARALVAANRYREARALYVTLEGTPHQGSARSEATAAGDDVVKEERLRAGRLFVAARKEASPETRATQLRAVRDLLASLLEDFPKSRYAPRVADNLVAVEKELEKLPVD